MQAIAGAAGLSIGLETKRFNAGTASSVLSPNGEPNMKIKSPKGLLALWTAFLAAGTWILPTTSLLDRADARLVQVTDDSVSPGVVALYNAAQDWLLAGGADLPAYCQATFDLDHDGANERIYVSPGSFLGSDGRVVVVDGASGAELFELRCPAGEGLFGESVAIAADVSSDGVDELLVATMTRDTPSGAFIGVQARIYSGADGKVLGLLSKPVPSPADEGTPAPTSTSFIGDANGDGALDLGDVATTVAKLSAGVERLPAADMDSDGSLSVTDLSVLLDRAVSPDAPLWLSVDAAIGELRLVHALVPPVVEGVVSAPTARMLFADLPSGSLASTPEPAPPVLVEVNCWLDGFLIAAHIAGLFAQFVGCGAITTSPMAPAAIWCWISAFCNAASILVQIVSFWLNCIADEGSPTRNAVLGLLERIFDICALFSGGGLAALHPDDFKKAWEAIREFHKHLRQWSW